MVKAQEYNMTYPKLLIKNPLNKDKNLIIPQIGNPAAGPPNCMTNPDIDRKDCQVPGKQYRVMYTTQRWVPDSDGNGKVQAGTEGATAMVLVPRTSRTTLRSSRGRTPPWVSPTPAPSPAEPLTFPFPEQTSWALVVWTSTSVTCRSSSTRCSPTVTSWSCPTTSASRSTARPPARRPTSSGPRRRATSTTPSMRCTPEPRTTVAGPTCRGRHRLRRHGPQPGWSPALWTGIEADTLGPQTGQNLKGVIAVAPATDINQLVNSQWDQQANWVIGPEVIQTWANYLPGFAAKNIVISDTALKNLNRYEDYCTTQAFAASNEFYPPGGP